MFAKLAKNMACFCVKNNLIKKEDEEIFEDGMELLLSAVSNLFAAVLIAVLTDSLIPCLIELTTFATMRIFAGGYHANTHIGCMITLILVQVLFVTIIKMVSIGTLKTITPYMMIISVYLIVILTPVAHTDKPLPDNLIYKLQKKAYILTAIWTAFSLTFLLLDISYISFCSAYGMVFVSGAMVADVLRLRMEK